MSSAPRPRRTDAGAFALAAAILLGSALAAAQPASSRRAPGGDAVRGERVFQRCFACHSVEPNETSQLPGPSLFRIVGRSAAALAGFEYSDAMKAKGAAGLVWTADTLDRFIADPDAFVPGTPMALPPLGDAQERADVIAYLAQARADRPSGGGRPGEGR